MSGTLAPSPQSFFARDDLDGFVETALDEHILVPISEGTVRIRRFESPLMEPVPVRTPAPPAKRARPSWILQLAEMIPARHEKTVAAGVLFFFMLGILSFLAGVTTLLFML